MNLHRLAIHLKATPLDNHLYRIFTGHKVAWLILACQSKTRSFCLFTFFWFVFLCWTEKEKRKKRGWDISKARCKQSKTDEKIKRMWCKFSSSGSNFAKKEKKGLIKKKKKKHHLMRSANLKKEKKRKKTVLRYKWRMKKDFLEERCIKENQKNNIWVVKIWCVSIRLSFSPAPVYYTQISTSISSLSPSFSCVTSVLRPEPKAIV